MLGTDASCDPNDSFRIGTGCVRYDLSEMIVVRVLELILDDQRAAWAIVTEDVEGEVSDGVLRTPERDLKPKRLREDISILQQLGREVTCLVRPKCTRIDVVNLADFHGHLVQAWAAGRGRAGLGECCRWLSKSTGPDRSG